MNPTEQELDRTHILYDADLLHTVDVAIFNADTLAAAALLTGEAVGRGNVFFFKFSGLNLVLRHYRRGGMMTPLLGDRYFFTGLDNTRAWREFKLLAKLWRQGLPVPQPVAARVVRRRLFYHADIVTRQIENSRTLADCLTDAALGAESWMAVGQSVGRLHAAGVFHADLNAHNILLTDDEQVHVIDFDRGRFMDTQNDGWKRHNLERLRRSLNKIAAARPGFNYHDGDWHRLLRAYRG